MTDYEERITTRHSSFGFSTEPAEDFRDRGLCAQTDPEAFFPEKGGSTREAKRICNGGPNTAPCPVKAECLEYALARDERFGIWGGLSERERRALKSTGVVTSAVQNLRCATCTGHIVYINRSGPPPKYCSKPCRELAYRRRSKETAA